MGSSFAFFFLSDNQELTVLFFFPLFNSYCLLESDVSMLPRLFLTQKSLERLLKLCLTFGINNTFTSTNQQA